MDWRDLLELIPVGVGLAKRDPGGAAFMHGWSRETSKLKEERLREQESQRREQALEAEMRNRSDDNRRMEQQARLQRLSMALQQFQPAMEQQIETATDPMGAAQMLGNQSRQLEQSFELQPGAMRPFVPSAQVMAPLISQAKIRRAKKLYAEFLQRYGDRAREMEDSVAAPGEEFATLSMRQVREMSESVAPPLREAKQPTPRQEPRLGDFEDYLVRYAQEIQKPIETLTARDIEAAKKRFGQSDDRAPTLSPSGFTPQQTAIFNQIATQYQRSPLVAATDRTGVLSDAVQTIEQNPSDSAAQLRLAYSYVQALDTYQSAVREGELQNLGILGTRLQQWQTELNRVAFQGAFLPPEVALSIAKDAKRLVQTIEDGRKRKEREFAARARTSGVGQMWADFMSGDQSVMPTAGTAPMPTKETMRPVPGHGPTRSPSGRFEILEVR